MVSTKLSRAWLLLMITLALPLVLVILAFLSRLTGSTDTAFAFLLMCTVSLYVSFAAGVVVPLWIVVVRLFGRSIERRLATTLLLLSVLNIAVAVGWIFFFVPRLQFRY